MFCEKQGARNIRFLIHTLECDHVYDPIHYSMLINITVFFRRRKIYSKANNYNSIDNDCVNCVHIRFYYIVCIFNLIYARDDLHVDLPSAYRIKYFFWLHQRFSAHLQHLLLHFNLLQYCVICRMIVR